MAEVLVLLHQLLPRLYQLLMNFLVKVLLYYLKGFSYGFIRQNYRVRYGPRQNGNRPLIKNPLVIFHSEILLEPLAKSVVG